MQPTSVDLKELIHKAQGLVLILGKRNPKFQGDDALAKKLHFAHIQYGMNLIPKGIVLSGGMIDDKDLKFAAILNIMSKEEAQRIYADDPAVRGGLYVIECYEWHGYFKDLAPIG